MWGFGTSTTDSARLARIERMLYNIQRVIGDNEMARKETDARVIAEVHRSSDVVKAVLAEWSKELADLTAALAAAIANSDASDDADVLAAVDELKASNDALAAKLVPPVVDPVVPAVS